MVKAKQGMLDGGHRVICLGRSWWVVLPSSLYPYKPHAHGAAALPRSPVTAHHLCESRLLIVDALRPNRSELADDKKWRNPLKLSH